MSFLIWRWCSSQLGFFLGGTSTISVWSCLLLRQEFILQERILHSSVLGCMSEAEGKESLGLLTVHSQNFTNSPELMFVLHSHPFRVWYPWVRILLVQFIQRLDLSCPVGVRRGWEAKSQGWESNSSLVRLQSILPFPALHLTPPFSDTCSHGVQACLCSAVWMVFGIFTTGVLGIVASSALKIHYIASLSALLQKICFSLLFVVYLSFSLSL